MPEMAVAEMLVVERAVETVVTIVAVGNFVEKVAKKSIGNYSILYYYSNFGLEVHYSSFDYYCFGCHSNYYCDSDFVHYYSSSDSSFDYYWLLVGTFGIHGHTVGMYDIRLLFNL